MKKRIFAFFLTKIIIGFVVVGVAAGLTQMAGQSLLANVRIRIEYKSLIVTPAVAIIALVSYVALFH
jgi:hypothetical protein